MPNSKQKLLQRIVTKYNLKQNVYGSYYPTSSLIRFGGGLLKLDGNIFYTCELRPTLEKGVPNYISFQEYIPVNNTKELHKRIQKILANIKKTELKVKKAMMNEKLNRIKQDFT
jgi:hypothetical protein